MNSEEILMDAGAEGAVYLDHPEYPSAIIGVTTDNRVVYDYSKLIEECVVRDGMTEEEAIDWVDFNVLGALPNGGELGPLVMNRIPE